MISTLYVIDGENKMKIIIRKFVMVAMAITILFTNVNMVEASELKADILLHMSKKQVWNQELQRLILLEDQNRHTR